MTPSRPEDPLQREIDAALEGINLQDIGREEEPAPGGDRLWKGVIAGISGDDVIVELGPRMQGVVSLAEFEETPQVGDIHRFAMRGREDDLYVLSMREAQEIAAWDETEVGSLVRARVTAQNQGGLELKIGEHEAFMPTSQVSLDRDADISSYIGQTLTCEVLEIDRGRRRCVISHRKFLEHERREAVEEHLGKLHTGMVVPGKVSRLESFGAFVDLGNGLEGMVHVSNLSRKRVAKPEDVVAKGQDVQVMVLEIKEGGRISLGMKQLEPDPWEGIGRRLQDNAVVTGKVTRIAEFGAFVELEAGVEGLLHVSQLGNDRVRRVGDAVKEGQEVTVRVISVDAPAQRISLSRLDPRGALLGSDEAVDANLIDEVLSKPGEGGHLPARPSCGGTIPGPGQRFPPPIPNPTRQCRSCSRSRTRCNRDR